MQKIKYTIVLCTIGSILSGCGGISRSIDENKSNRLTNIDRSSVVTEVNENNQSNVKENHVPTVSDVNIKGTAKTGETLTLSYDFIDEDGDAEGKSVIAWSTATKELQRSTSKTFTIPADYEGQTISASVHPKDAQGLEGVEVSARNDALKILTQYEEAVTLPQYDATNQEMMLIKSNEDWENINNEGKRFFFVEPGDYSPETKGKGEPAGVRDYFGRIKLTKSGTKDKKRYIILHNGNNTHPGKLKREQLAKVGFILQGANYWVIDRMSYWDNKMFHDADKKFPKLPMEPIQVKSSSYNIFNRLYFHDAANGLYIFNRSHANIVQNSRFERDDIALHYDRAGVCLFNTREHNISIKNTKIINNEMRNLVDGVQTTRLDENTHLSDLNVEGTIIDNNHFYIDTTIYTDCNGVHDENGSCAYTENAIDLKMGSLNSKNPVIISNNKMWGFRKSDKTNSTLNDPGALLPIHYGVDNVIIKNNIGFDSTEGITIGDPKKYTFSLGHSRIENNIFQNIKTYGLYVSDAQELTIKNNLFKKIGKESKDHWIVFNNSKDLNFSENIVVDTFGKSSRLKEDNIKFSASNNQYYNSNDKQQVADKVNRTDVILDVDATANYKDMVFTTDRYTKTPRIITVPKVINPE